MSSILYDLELEFRELCLLQDICIILFGIREYVYPQDICITYYLEFENYVYPKTCRSIY